MGYKLTRFSDGRYVAVPMVVFQIREVTKGQEQIRSQLEPK